MVYCRSCDEVFLKSRIEKNLCPNCGGRTRGVSVGLSWQYATATIVLLSGAVLIFILNTRNLIVNVLLFILFAVIAFLLSSWGVEDQKKEALSLARKEREEG